MRDIHTYPITKTEIINCLNDLAKEIGEENAVGNMRPMLLRAAASIVEKQEFEHFKDI
jgi:hypothetical protein